MLICKELSFYAAQLACLLPQFVEANKKVGVQECRRWKPWALCGESSEFIVAQPQTTLNAKWARPGVQNKRQEQN